VSIKFRLTESSKEAIKPNAFFAFSIVHSILCALTDSSISNAALLKYIYKYRQVTKDAARNGIRLPLFQLLTCLFSAKL